MARYYRKRRYGKRNNSIGDAAGLLALLALAYTYTGVQKFTEQNPYGLAIIIAVSVVVFALITGLVIYRAIRAKHIYDAITLAQVDTMDGLEFERYLADLLRKKGFTDVRLTERFDYGIDIIAQKDGIKWGIQAKRYNSPVKASAVRQVYTALTRYGCSRAMVIANNTYTRPAKLLAQDNNIELIDRQILSEWIYDVSRANSKVAKQNRGAIL